MLIWKWFSIVVSQEHNVVSDKKKNIMEDPFCINIVVRSKKSESSKYKSVCCSTVMVHPWMASSIT